MRWFITLTAQLNLLAGNFDGSKKFQLGEIMLMYILTLFAGEWQNMFERLALSAVWVAVCIIIKLGLPIKDKIR